MKPTKEEETKFEEWFKNFNTWDLTGEQFLQCCLKLNDTSSPKSRGIIVYISPKTGSELTYYQADRWHEKYEAYKTGWFACLEHAKKNNQSVPNSFEVGVGTFK